MGSVSLWSYVFVCAFVAIATAETFVPLSRLSTPTGRRWTSNLVLFAASSAAGRLVLQLSTVAIALVVSRSSSGLLKHDFLPYAVQFALTIALIDLTAYASHRLLHAFSLTWRVHQVHHAESELDLTSGLRFHPLEALISRSLIVLVIAISAPPAAAVAFAELVIVVQDFLQHANLRLPETLDRALRLLIVTPAMHRLHHSELIAQQNANFGTVFSLWDRLFGTFLVPHPAQQGEVRCGLSEMPNSSRLNAAQLLLLPFRRNPGSDYLEPVEVPRTTQA